MNKTAVIVVDMIYDFTNPNGKVYYPLNAQVLPKIIDLVAHARAQGCQIAYMQHVTTPELNAASVKKTRECCLEGSGGEALDERLDVQTNDWVVRKHKYSSFFQTDLHRRLQERGITQLIVVGTKTNNCVYATVLDAYNLGYLVRVPVECVGTSDPLTNEIYLRDIGKYLGEVQSLEQILSDLQRGIL